MSERHTRGSLNANSALDATPQARQARRFAMKGGAKQDLDTLGSFDCWCHEPSGHDWPDKKDGAPHPPHQVKPNAPARPSDF